MLAIVPLLASLHREERILAGAIKARMKEFLRFLADCLAMRGALTRA